MLLYLAVDLTNLFLGTWKLDLIETEVDSLTHRSGR